MRDDGPVIEEIEDNMKVSEIMDNWQNAEKETGLVVYDPLINPRVEEDKTNIDESANNPETTDNAPLVANDVNPESENEKDDDIDVNAIMDNWNQPNGQTAPAVRWIKDDADINAIESNWKFIEKYVEEKKKKRKQTKHQDIRAGDDDLVDDWYSMSPKNDSNHLVQNGFFAAPSMQQAIDQNQLAMMRKKYC